MQPPEPLTEDRDAYYLDDKARVWSYSGGPDAPRQGWWSPDITAFTLRTWDDLCTEPGLRRATPDEQVEIDEEMFS